MPVVSLPHAGSFSLSLLLLHLYRALKPARSVTCSLPLLLVPRCARCNPAADQSFIFLATEDTNDLRSEQKSHLGTSCTEVFLPEERAHWTDKSGFQRGGFSSAWCCTSGVMYSTTLTQDPEGEYGIENILPQPLLLRSGCLQCTKSFLHQMQVIFPWC